MVQTVSQNGIQKKTTAIDTSYDGLDILNGWTKTATLKSSQRSQAREPKDRKTPCDMEGWTGGRSYENGYTRREVCGPRSCGMEDALTRLGL